MRTKVALIVLASMLALAAGPLFGAGLAHIGCAARHHDCAKEPMLTGCCCGDDAESWTPPATTASNRPDRGLAGDPLDAGPAVLVDACALSPSHSALGLADASPPFSHPVALPILFSDLRL
jgi:hypothetical protein